MRKKEFIISCLIAFVAALLFLAISLIVFLNNGETAFDNNIANSMYNFRGEKGGFIYFLFRMITEFGYIYVSIVIGIIGLVYTGIDRGLILFAFGYVLQAVINIAFKTMFNRERPLETMRWQVDNESSFPSGHSATVAFMFPYITYYLFKTKRQNWLKYTVLGITVAIIPLVMWSRLVLGMHYFTDVVAGFSIGIFSFSITTLFYLWFEKYDLFTKGLINFFGKKKNEKKNEENIEA